MNRKIVGIALAAVLLAAALFSGVALAQSDTSAERGPLQTFLEKLAANLGIDQAKLTDAVKQTQLQMIDEDVQQGRLTSDQAEKIKAQIEAGQPAFGPFGPRPFGRHEAGLMGNGRLDAVAEALGMTVDELQTELEQGKKLSEIAQEKGVTADELHKKMVEARIQAIQQAVKDGKISQDRADEMIQRLQNAPQREGFGRLGPPFGPPAAGQTEETN
ncbi:MAG: hypothetical protein QMC81_09625 [Thermoanaerobacterales bacterium]|nr:hypothetical protein [Thermoanaerobacterales bacterium]